METGELIWLMGMLIALNYEWGIFRTFDDLIGYPGIALPSASSRAWDQNESYRPRFLSQVIWWLRKLHSLLGCFWILLSGKTSPSYWIWWFIDLPRKKRTHVIYRWFFIAMLRLDRKANCREALWTRWDQCTIIVSKISDNWLSLITHSLEWLGRKTWQFLWVAAQSLW